MEKVLAVVDIGSKTVFSPAANFKTWGDLVNIVTRNALVIAGVTAFILLIVTGFQFIVGGGDVKKYDQAKQNILYILIGLIVVAISVLIIQVIQTITGIPIVQP